MSPSAHHNNGGDAYRSAMDKVLEKNPPHIVWRKNKHGIQVAVQVIDPHTEARVPSRGRRLRLRSAAFNRDYLDRLTAFAAVLAAEETEPEDETLLNAARTEL